MERDGREILLNDKNLLELRGMYDTVPGRTRDTSLLIYFFKAIEHNNQRYLDYLETKIDFKNIFDAQKHSILELALQFKPDYIEKLISFGIDINVEVDQENILFYCCEHQPQTVETALKYGANINQVSKDGHTPFMHFCSKQPEYALKYLEQHTPEFNRVADNGYTALTYAYIDLFDNLTDNPVRYALTEKMISMGAVETKKMLKDLKNEENVVYKPLKSLIDKYQIMDKINSKQLPDKTPNPIL